MEQTEETEVEEPQDPAELAGGGDLELEGDHHHGHHQGEGQDSTQLVQQVGEGRHAMIVTQHNFAGHEAFLNTLY